MFDTNKDGFIDLNELKKVTLKIMLISHLLRSLGYFNTEF